MSIKKGDVTLFEVTWGWVMPRLARTVFAKPPHHIPHRDNRLEDVFLTDADREVCLAWLEPYCQIKGSVPFSGKCAQDTLVDTGNVSIRRCLITKVEMAQVMTCNTRESSCG